MMYLFHALFLGLPPLFGTLHALTQNTSKLLRQAPVRLRTLYLVLAYGVVGRLGILLERCPSGPLFILDVMDEKVEVLLGHVSCVLMHSCLFDALL
ncbi:MAG: hypothetical protein K2L45_12285 [Muribaculaceae bacterium]|nr:hypothetical protein [Muribaculaceae bacterium]